MNLLKRITNAVFGTNFSDQKTGEITPPVSPEEKQKKDEKFFNSHLRIVKDDEPLPYCVETILAEENEDIDAANKRKDQIELANLMNDNELTGQSSTVPAKVENPEPPFDDPRSVNHGSEDEEMARRKRRKSTYAHTNTPKVEPINYFEVIYTKCVGGTEDDHKYDVIRHVGTATYAASLESKLKERLGYAVDITSMNKVTEERYLQFKKTNK